jgi:putative PIN family toxin of toxin-antitoxin system
MRVNRFVLDTNVWISYLITLSSDKLINAVASGRITIYICEELIIELKRVLTYSQLKKYDIDVKVAIDIVKEIGVEYKLTYPIKRYIPGDFDDDYIVALALQTNSGFITSGDRHILAEKNALETKYKKLQIITKSEFEKRIALK